MWAGARGGLPSHRVPIPLLPSPQGLPIREGLQISFKIVRDKSIREALIFLLYMGVFLLISFVVRIRSQTPVFCARAHPRPPCVLPRVRSCGTARRPSFRIPRRGTPSCTRPSACELACRSRAWAASHSLSSLPRVRVRCRNPFYEQFSDISTVTDIWNFLGGSNAGGGDGQGGPVASGLWANTWCGPPVPVRHSHVDTLTCLCVDVHFPHRDNNQQYDTTQIGYLLPRLDNKDGTCWADWDPIYEERGPYGPGSVSSRPVPS